MTTSKPTAHRPVRPHTPAKETNAETGASATRLPLAPDEKEPPMPARRKGSHKEVLRRDRGCGIGSGYDL